MKKSGKNDNFWGCGIWSRFYKDMLLSKASGGVSFNYRFHGLDGFATEKILLLRSGWIQIRSIRLIRSLFSLSLV